MAPPPVADMTRIASALSTDTDSTLSASAARQASGSWANSGVVAAPPALLTSPCSGRPIWAAAAKIASRSPPAVTSADSELARPPWSTISRSVSASISARRPTSRQWAPLCATRRAVARPMPEPAPVMMITPWTGALMERLS